MPDFRKTRSLRASLRCIPGDRPIYQEFAAKFLSSLLTPGFSLEVN
ncbi:hypothetical protein [Leptolyngbya ohadii]|nr:hypothetical protein [Leptolyngbya ohadii]